MKVPKTVRVVICMLAALAVLASCSSGGGDDDKNASLVINLQLANASADPHRDGTVIGRTLFRPVYDTLTEFSGQDLSEPEPGLATEWSSDASAKTWTFKIRSGVKFSDGTPLTAKDVVFSLNRFKNLKSSFSFLLQDITIASPDDATVVLSSKTPNVALPYIVAYPEMSILNSKVLQANGGSDAKNADEADKAEQFFAKGSIGSGPYVMTTFSTTSRIVFKPNPYYWGEKPALSRIVVDNTNAQAQLQNVQNGRADIAMDLNNTQLSSLSDAASAKLQVDQAPGPVVWYFYLSLDPGLSTTTSNPDFREALRYSIDYEALGALFGKGADRSCGILPSMIQAALPKTDCPKQDLARAKDALARSGIANPTLEMDYLSAYAIDGIQTQTIAQFLQSQFEKIGVKVKLVGNPLSTELDRYNSGKVPALLWSVSMRYPDLSGYVSAFTFGSNGKPAGMAPGRLPEIDALANKILSATSAQERAAATEEWQRKLNEDGPFVPLYQSARLLVGSKSVTNMKLSPIYLLDFGKLGHAQK